MPRVAPNLARALPTDYEGLVRRFPLRAIHDEVGYENAQDMIDRLTCVPKLSRGQRDYLEALTVLFESYEERHLALDLAAVTPLEALRSLMEACDMTASQLGMLLGERSLGSKILNGHRELSKAHIVTLCGRFKVEPGVFLRIA
jgi:HTH-type transcriptional regulator / antitoxin HigA